MVQVFMYFWQLLVIEVGTLQPLPQKQSPKKIPNWSLRFCRVSFWITVGNACVCVCFCVRVCCILSMHVSITSVSQQLVQKRSQKGALGIIVGDCFCMCSGALNFLGCDVLRHLWNDIASLKGPGTQMLQSSIHIRYVSACLPRDPSWNHMCPFPPPFRGLIGVLFGDMFVFCFEREGGIFFQVHFQCLLLEG